ncbi:putative pentatricopeptide repeat-containing protein At3g25970 [Olea europaea var. sylvestris]|uniref:putative pentatricopeptide repeat-containing protein At3g25970 n=1 Tax=Olea europaea var. sylvestris TaxID=158386 RepID=UPI000C1CDC0B|nr:putative pentatricopeptide repeat-containing protein At3g25970 [Olea europaea var. sylvestris]
MRPLQIFTETTLANLSKVLPTHCQAIKVSQITDTYTANNIINSYIKCKDLSNALKLFDEMPTPDTVSWNTLIAGYVNSGCFDMAWEVLKSMKNNGFVFDGYTFGSIFKGVASSNHLECGQQVHADVIKMGYKENVYAASALLDMYVKCDRVGDGSVVFNDMPERNSVSWNALIAGYAEMGDHKRCSQLMLSMEREGVGVDDATFAPLLTVLDGVEFCMSVKQIHGKIMKLGLEFDNTVYNALITAYSKCGCIDDAERIFDITWGYRDLVTWNSMLAAYTEHDQEKYGFKLFLEMEKLGLEPDIYTYTTIISACFVDSQQSQGRSFHALVLKRGFERLTPIANALISMYLKSNNSSINNALKIFEFMHVKDLVSWNTILTGLSQNGLSENALKLFGQMHLEYRKVDHYAFSAVLRSCSDLATLQLGRQIHALVAKSGFEVNEYVASALIFMYSKCGIIGDAWKSFDASCKDSSITWNSIIFAYAQHGQGKVALDLFSLMREKDVQLDHITFVAVLTACSHIGLVEEGLTFLKSMETEYGVRPQMENYACAIDLLGRAGRLLEAKELIKEMPFEPDAMVWKTLLGACRSCGDIELATQVACHLLEPEPGEHCTYVLLSDMYGHLKRWDEKANVKRLMKERGVKKVPGWSWIEVQNEVHAFNAEDHSHPCCQDVYQILRELADQIKISEIGNNSIKSLDDLDLVDENWIPDDHHLLKSVKI